MQITKTGIKPCSQCYKARQFTKDTLGRLVAKGEPASRMEIVVSIGSFVTETTGHTLVSTPPGYEDLIGRKVYVAGKKLIDVVAAEGIPDIGPVTRTRKYHV